MLDDVPNDIGVHGKVIVNQNVSHAHYLRPGYALLTVAKLLRKRARRVAFDIRYPIKDIPESFLRVSHRAAKPQAKVRRTGFTAEAQRGYAATKFGISLAKAQRR